MKCFSKQLLLQALEEAKGSREKKWSWCNSESTLALDFISTDIKKWLSDRSPTVSVSPPLSLTLTPSHTHKLPCQKTYSKHLLYVLKCVSSDYNSLSLTVFTCTYWAPCLLNYLSNAKMLVSKACLSLSQMTRISPRSQTPITLQASLPISLTLFKSHFSHIHLSSFILHTRHNCIKYLIPCIGLPSPLTYPLPPSFSLPLSHFCIFVYLHQQCFRIQPIWRYTKYFQSITTSSI